MEATVREIPLTGLAAKAGAEISGMAWCGETLILMPQYPGQYQFDGQAAVFSISKDDLLAWTLGKEERALEPALIPFDQGGLNTSIKGFEGFEAIAFFEHAFYVTIEASLENGMQGYLVRGSVEEGCSRLRLDPQQIVAINPQASLSNMSDETLVIFEDRIHTIYEANGLNVNLKPIVHVFDLNLNQAGELPLPQVEYRITDATQVDDLGRFWAINYYFPGDTKLEPADDRIALTYGIGASHATASQVERLIAFEIAQDEIRLLDQPPLYLELKGADARNWEGIVHFKEGFLLVTDKFPKTILAYVARP